AEIKRFGLVALREAEAIEVAAGDEDATMFIGERGIGRGADVGAIHAGLHPAPLEAVADAAVRRIGHVLRARTAIGGSIDIEAFTTAVPIVVDGTEAGVGVGRVAAGRNRDQRGEGTGAALHDDNAGAGEVAGLLVIAVSVGGE